MARKLKSDKVLFLATLLLVLASVVMVYSASAAMADVRFGNPHLFLVEAGDVGGARHRAHDGRHARGLPRLAAAGAHLGRAGLRGSGLDRRPLQHADQRHPAVVRHCRVRHPALRDRQAGGHLLHGGAARTADEPDQRPEGNADAARRGRRRTHGSHPARARLWHVRVPGRDGGIDAVFGGPEPALRRRRGGGGPCSRRRAHRRLAVPAEAGDVVPVARGGPARIGVPAASVAHRGRQRRRDRDAG